MHDLGLNFDLTFWELGLVLPSDWSREDRVGTRRGFGQEEGQREWALPSRD